MGKTYSKNNHSNLAKNAKKFKEEKKKEEKFKKRLQSLEN